MNIKSFLDSLRKEWKNKYTCYFVFIPNDIPVNRLGDILPYMLESNKDIIHHIRLDPRTKSYMVIIHCSPEQVWKNQCAIAGKLPIYIVHHDDIPITVSFSEYLLEIQRIGSELRKSR